MSHPPSPSRLTDTLARPVRLFPPGLGVRPERIIAEAGLPASLAELTTRVVRRTRLWSSERADVARELIAHFRDGLAAGAEPDDLVRMFGDPVHTARLIRRAKRRCRPRAWRVAAALSRGLGAVIALAVAVYLVGAAQAFLSTPTVRRNYVAELNETIARVPESERAWPLYREAYLAQPRMPEAIVKDFPGIEPTDDRWPLAQVYLRDSARTLELLREAALRPSLGRPISAEYEPELDAHSRYLSGVDLEKARAEAFADAASRVHNPNPELYTVLLPYLGHGRHFARMLALDANAAAESGDAARTASDLETMYRLAGHMRDNGFLIGELVGLAIHALACETFASVLSQRPALLGDEHLVAVAHAATRFPMAVSFDGERLFMADTLQRTYSDDGDGDGHLTARGMAYMRALMSTPGNDTPDAVLDTLTAPALTLVSASRREVWDLYTRMMDETQAYGATPPWLRTSPAPDVRIERLANSLNGRRYLLISMLMPALSSTIARHDQAALTRDGVLVGAALEMYRRARGTYPARLADIPTSLLPAVPTDLFDGKPVRYALRDAKPLVYSVGADRKDDAGRPPAPGGDAMYAPSRWRPATEAAEILRSPQGSAIDGDWILWPPASRVPAPR